MRIYIIAFFLMLSVNGVCQTFTKVWQTDSLFKKPESVLYDSDNNIMYVSNPNEGFLTENADGFISKLKTDGKVENLHWVTGLNNPQGMGLYNGLLYVADINRIVKINTKTGTIEGEVKIDSAKFLNDLSIDNNGKIYVSDCFGDKIYESDGFTATIWSQDTLLNKPNGLLCQKDSLFVLNSDSVGKVFKASVTSKHLEEICSGIDVADGIVRNGVGNYFVSGCWQGKVYSIKENGEKTLMLNLGTENTFTADIEYIPSLKLLLIPTYNKTVIAYRLKE